MAISFDGKCRYDAAFYTVGCIFYKTAYLVVWGKILLRNPIFKLAHRRVAFFSTNTLFMYLYLRNFKALLVSTKREHTCIIGIFSFSCRHSYFGRY